MRASQYYLSTLKEAPAEAELISHKLMLRAGLIKRLGSGLYSWMPLGLRVLRKVEAVVRDEMARTAKAHELLMPAVQPAELWQESGRWEFYGKELLRLKDRHERDFVIGPTHEEVVTDIVRRDVQSYRQLPVNLYQIQTKFRDEIRPRFGVMRAREFVMKDGYSFHTDFASLEQTYWDYHRAYCNVFTRLGLKFRAVAADTGSIGGTGSHEFQVLADSGEDEVVWCPQSEYAANIELAEAVAPAHARPAASQPLSKVHTPGIKTIAQLCEFLKVPVERTVKAVVVDGNDGRPVLLMVRGDHSLNEIKAEKLTQVKVPLTFSSPEAIREAFGANPGSLGPVNFPGTVVMDRTVDRMADFVIGANEDDQHYTGANIGRDFPEPLVADIRDVVAGDPSPDGKGTLEICRGVEVGHIFQLRTKYSEALQCNWLDREGQTHPMEMGCYGIGISRVVAACIEQNHDERGIVFPPAMAPFTLALVSVGADRNPAVATAAEQLYSELQAAGVEVLLDDRDERPGVKFADMELIGIPFRVTIGGKGLEKGVIEFVRRADGVVEELPLADACAAIRRAIGA
ncbi:proline--tRNA ligase [Leeia aquatica]|uniref:Proline--tRNA ligase n=1 Tax=Leeia aquatica TaxID=2725557 RepID=A0A847S9N9_9NEIS|nr:proline--tRNA ligase [Leeia aquatica]NLR76463.1 proline--tRNA ligase [Leeia aquatica]